MRKTLPGIFLINFFVFGQQEIPFSNKKDEFVKVVSYTDGSFSIFTSNNVNWGKTISRFYDANNNLIKEASLPPKVGVSCTINGSNNLKFPEMTTYHPELKLTLMLGGVSGPILPPQMVCRILNEKGQFTDVKFGNFRETNHKLVSCEVHGNNLMVVYSSNHLLRQDKFWLAVIDLKNKIIDEREVVFPTERVGSYIGFRDGRFYFLSTENEDSATLSNVDGEAKVEQTPIDFPTDLFSRQKFSGEVNRFVQAIHPVKYYTALPEGEICFMLYGRESFICNITPDNEVLYQPVLVPDSLKVISYIPETDQLVDFRKAVMVDTKKGIELLISISPRGADWEPCLFGRWKIEWDYAETVEPLDIHKGIILGRPLDMIAYSSKNPEYEEWKESQDEEQHGVLLHRVLEDFKGGFSFMEFSNSEGKIPNEVILYK